MGGWGQSPFHPTALPYSKTTRFTTTRCTNTRLPCPSAQDRSSAPLVVVVVEHFQGRRDIVSYPCSFSCGCGCGKAAKFSAVVVAVAAAEVAVAVTAAKLNAVHKLDQLCFRSMQWLWLWLS